MAEKSESLGSHVQARVTLDEFNRIKEHVGNAKGAMQQFARAALIAALSDPSTRAPKSAAESRLHDMVSQIVSSGDQEAIGWLRQTLQFVTEHRESLNPDEARLIEEYRRSSLDKRRRMLGFIAKGEDLGPEVMGAEPKRDKEVVSKRPLKKA